MSDKYGKKWTREETILAFDLYCRTPFGKISKSNKDVIELAKTIDRTPSAVNFKMANLAHYDPDLAARNIKGMSNASKLDKEIVEELYGDWEELSYQAEKILSNFKHIDIETLHPELFIEHFPKGSDIKRETKIRVGQYFFRKAVLASYDQTCCITGTKWPEVLVASHIKPWKNSDEKTERTNPRNGLCLNAFHDKAFDRGFITIDKQYRIVLSKRICDIKMDNDTQEWFYSYANKEIRLPDKFLPNKEFIEYHNDVIFLG